LPLLKFQYIYCVAEFQTKDSGECLAGTIYYIINFTFMLPCIVKISFLLTNQTH